VVASRKGGNGRVVPARRGGGRAGASASARGWSGRRQWQCEVLVRAAAAGASLAPQEKERHLEAVMADDVVVAMAAVTCSTKCVNGVNLRVLA
jgi:hypothetical protein